MAILASSGAGHAPFWFESCRVQHSIAAALPPHTRTASYAPALAYIEPVISVGLAVLIALLVVLTGHVPRFLRQLEPWTCAALAVAMLAAGRFRQTFLLDPERERGFHWRGFVTWLGKTPALLLAALDVLANRRFEYVMTPKVKRSAEPVSVLSICFGAVAIVFAAAWLAGMYTNPDYETPAHVVAITAVASCLAIIASQLPPAPHPFDAALARARLAEERVAPCQANDER